MAQLGAGAREENGMRLQAPRRWHSWSADRAEHSLKMATAREPINSPGQAVRRPDLRTRNSETVEVSQKLIFLEWEKDEAKPFFTCFPCKPLSHEEIKFNSFVAAPTASMALGGLDPTCSVALLGYPHLSPPHCPPQGRAA